MLLHLLVCLPSDLGAFGVTSCSALHPCLQGEMIQAKFGSSSVAERQLEIYSTAVLLATERPPKAPRCAAQPTGFSMSARLSLT